jgi:hypothetical protein
VYLGFLQQIGAGVFRFGGVGDADQVAVDVVAFGGVAGLARIVGAGGVDGAILVAVVAGLSQRIGAGVAVLARNGDVVGAQVAGAVVAIVDGLGLDGEAGERLLRVAVGVDVSRDDAMAVARVIQTEAGLLQQAAIGVVAVAGGGDAKGCMRVDQLLGFQSHMVCTGAVSPIIIARRTDCPLRHLGVV